MKYLATGGRRLLGLLPLSLQLEGQHSEGEGNLFLMQATGGGEAGSYSVTVWALAQSVTGGCQFFAEAILTTIGNIGAELGK